MALDSAGPGASAPTSIPEVDPSIKNHLAFFTHGVVGQWTLPKKVGRDYVEQMTAEVREERENSRGSIKVLWVQKRRDNH